MTLIGCSDGFVRRMSPRANDEDGTGIDARVICGPYSDEKDDRDLLMTQIHVTLAPDQAGCQVNLYGSDEAQPVPDAPPSRPPP